MFTYCLNATVYIQSPGHFFNCFSDAVSSAPHLALLDFISKAPLLNAWLLAQGLTSFPAIAYQPKFLVIWASQ